MAKRKYGKNIAFMMEFVRKFIDEELSRFDITCDFNHHIIQRYDDMYDENPEIAEIIGRDMGDIIDNSDHLTDDELRDALCSPYDLVIDIINGKVTRPCRLAFCKDTGLFGGYVIFSCIAFHCIHKCVRNWIHCVPSFLKNWHKKRAIFL